MDEKINKSKQVLIDKLDLPRDVVLDVPKIIVIGRGEITIENHKGILAFDERHIKINTNSSPIIIKGNKFEILYISAGTITISGHFDSIEYER